MVKNFICDKYGGIRQKTAQFSDNVITCSDMQNVELFYTGINSGVGIRTVKGQKKIKQLPNGERVVNIFESIQNGKSNCFVHSISNENVYEITDGQTIAYTAIKGLQGNKFPEDQNVYMEPSCSSILGSLNTELSIICSNPNLEITNNYIGVKEEIGTEVKVLKYCNIYDYDKNLITYYGDIEKNYDNSTSNISGFSVNDYFALTNYDYNLFSGDITYPSSKGQFKEIGDCRECQITIDKEKSSGGSVIQFVINGIVADSIYVKDFTNSNSIRLGKIKSHIDYWEDTSVYVEIKWTENVNGTIEEKSKDIPIWGRVNHIIGDTKYETIGIKLTKIETMLFRTTHQNTCTITLADSYITDNQGGKKYFSEKIGEKWFENKEIVDLNNYSIQVSGPLKISDTITLTYYTKQVLLNNFTYTGNITEGYSKLYLYDFSTNKLTQKLTGLKRQTVSSGVDYKQGYDDCFVFCNKDDYLYKIQLNKTTTAYQVRCEDIIGYVPNNGSDSVLVGDTIYSDTNLTIPYKTIKKVYEVKKDGNTGYTDIQGTENSFVSSKTLIYLDTKLTQVVAQSTGEDYKYSGNTKLDYDFKYTGYVDKEISKLEVKDAENREIKPNFICNYNNRIYGAIKNRLHASMQQNIYDWSLGDTEKPTSAYYIEFSKDITAITPYLDSSLAVFFKDSSLLVKGNYPELQVTEESPGGCANYKSLVFHGTDLYFYDDNKKGIFSFQQVVLGNKTLGKDIALEVNSFLNIIDSTKIEDIKFFSYVADDRNEIWVLLPTTDPDYSTILIFDSLRGEWVKRKSKKIYDIETINNILISGGVNLYQEYINNDFDGEFIQNYYNCSSFNLGSNTSMKILYLRPRMSVALPYMNEFYVKYEKNFNTFKKPKIKKIKSKYKNYLVWGKGHWGVNYWAGGETNTILKLPNVSAFKTLDISFYTTNSNENFAIRNMEMNQIDSIQT